MIHSVKTIAAIPSARHVKRFTQVERALIVTARAVFSHTGAAVLVAGGFWSMV